MSLSYGLCGPLTSTKVYGLGPGLNILPSYFFSTLAGVAYSSAPVSNAASGVLHWQPDGTLGGDLTGPVYDPIIQHDPDGSNPRLANVVPFNNPLLHNKAFSNAAWSKINVTPTDNDAVSPTGATDATKLQPSSSAGVWDVRQTVAVPNDTVTRSGIVFLNAAVAHSARIRLFYSGGTAVTYDANINVTTEWQEFIVTGANNGLGNTSLAFQIFPDLEGGAVPKDYVHAYIPQLPDLAYSPGVYLPTTSAAAAFTGSANEIVTANGLPKSIVLRGVVFDNVTSGVSQTVLDYGTSPERVTLYKFSGNDRIAVLVTDGGVATVNSSVDGPVVVAGTEYNIGLRLVANDFSLVVNGVEYATDTVCTMPTLTDRKVGYNLITAGAEQSGSIKSIEEYEGPLTTDELVEATL